MSLDKPKTPNNSNKDQLSQLTKPQTSEETNKELRNTIGFPVDLPAGVKINYGVQIPFYAQKVKKDLAKAKPKIDDVFKTINHPKMKFGSVKEINVFIDEATLGTRVEIKCEYKDTVVTEVERKGKVKKVYRVPTVWTTKFSFLETPKGTKFWKKREKSVNPKDKAKLLQKVIKEKETSSRQEDQATLDSLLNSLDEG